MLVTKLIFTFYKGWVREEEKKIVQARFESSSIWGTWCDNTRPSGYREPLLYVVI